MAEDRKKDAIILVMQSMLSNTRAGITLDITEHEFKVILGSKCLARYTISKELWHIDYCSDTRYLSTRNTEQIANALNIPNKGINTIVFESESNVPASIIYVDRFRCRVYGLGTSLSLDLDEATRAFVKLKELGYTINKV
jgi:hypothetical protein